MIPGVFYSKLLVDLSTYKIKDTKIGEGSYGEVHEAIRPADSKHPDKHPEMKCAVKYLAAGTIKTRDDQKHFHSEVACQYSLKHPTILPLLGYSFPFQGRGHYAIVTKFMPNGSLLQLNSKVESGQAPDNWETIKAINIFGIAAGMAYIHQHNIIHRDLKSDNVLLDENYYPKIADFGFSKVFEEGTQNQINQTMNIGTPIYLPPEIIVDHDCHYSNKIDVFAYSIILYELTTQHRPWHDKKDVTVFNLVKYAQEGLRPTIRNREIPDEYVELIGRCWDSNPQKRPSFIRIVKGFMDHKEEYFNLALIDEEKFDDYVALVTEGLDFSKISDDED